MADAHHRNAAPAVRDLGLGRYGFERLISLIEPDNVGSCKVAERVGMRHERTVEKWGKRIHLYSLDQDVS